MSADANTIEHPALPEGEWWSCTEDVPAEAAPPVVIGLRHYRPGCEGCYLRWRVAAMNPRQTFYTAKDRATPKTLHPGHSEADLRAWWFHAPPASPVPVEDADTPQGEQP